MMNTTKANSIYSAFKAGLPLLVFLLCKTNVLGQQVDSLRFLPRHYGMEIGTQAIATTGDWVPFWMRSNQNGSIPLDGVSGSITARIVKDYRNDTTKNAGFDWGGGVDLRINAGSTAQFIPVEAYLKAKYSIFQIRGGRFKNITGLVDSTLSSGAFSVSNNALGIPQVEIGIPEYWNLPYTKELIALKGSISHGWFGTYTLRSQNQYVSEAGAYYHQKSLYGRIGKPSWKVKLYGGINHQAMWGNEREIFGPGFELSNFESFIHVFLGKAYGNNKVPTSKIGNQLGSVDQMIEIDLKDIKLTGYHQFFYDIGGLYHLTNIRDGLWGLSISNQNKNARALVDWDKFLIEFLYSKSQGGEIDSKPTPSGAEDYYNNFLYYKGWSYSDENIGNPLFTSKKYMRDDLPQRESEYFGNNRIAAFHVGGLFRFYGWNCKTMLTFSSNYGTYARAPAAKSIGGHIVYNAPPHFQKVNQFSGLIEIEKPIWQGYHLGLVLATDNGQLLYNSVGGGIKLSRRW